jgi:hypothetical protein
MDSQQEKLSFPPEKPSFYGLPAGLHLWARVGPTYWGGVLAGLGLRSFHSWGPGRVGGPGPGLVGGIGVLLAGIGQVIAFRTVRRSLRLDFDALRDRDDFKKLLADLGA